MRKTTLFAMAAIAALAVAGCDPKKPNEQPKNQTVAISGKIQQMPTGATPYTLNAIGYRGTGKDAKEFDFVSATVAADGSVSLTLSEAYNGDMQPVSNIWFLSEYEGENATKLNFSNDKVKFGCVDLQLRDKDKKPVGSEFIYGTGKYEERGEGDVKDLLFAMESRVYLTYADGNCDVTGSVSVKDRETGAESAVPFEVKLVKGWNKVIAIYDKDDNVTKITSTAPADLGLFYCAIW